MIFKHIRSFDWNFSGKFMEVSSFGGATIAIEELKSWVLPTLNPGDFFEKRVGIAICSDKDRFNKQIGRELAKNKAKPTKLTVQKVIKELNKTTVNVVDSSGNCYVFIKYANAKSTFFVDFKFEGSLEY